MLAPIKTNETAGQLRNHLRISPSRSSLDRSASPGSTTTASPSSSGDSGLAVNDRNRRAFFRRSRSAEPSGRYRVFVRRFRWILELTLYLTTSGQQRKMLNLPTGVPKTKIEIRFCEKTLHEDLSRKRERDKEREGRVGKGLPESFRDNA